MFFVERFQLLRILRNQGVWNLDVELCSDRQLLKLPGGSLGLREKTDTEFV